MEIPAKPEIDFCASCMQALIWLFSYRTERVFSVVADGPDGFRVHRCAHGQDRSTWKALQARPGPEQVELNAAGRALVDQTLGIERSTEQ